MMFRKIQVLEILFNEIVDRTDTVHADFHQGDQLILREYFLINILIRIILLSILIKYKTTVTPKINVLIF